MIWHIVYMVTNHDDSREYVVRQVEAASMMLAKQAADRGRVALKRERSARGVMRHDMFDEETPCYHCGGAIGSATLRMVAVPDGPYLNAGPAHATCPADTAVSP